MHLDVAKADEQVNWPPCPSLPRSRVHHDRNRLVAALVPSPLLRYLPIVLDAWYSVVINIVNLQNRALPGDKCLGTSV